MEIRIDKNQLSGVRKMLLELRGQFPRAFSRALNKTVTGTRTDLVGLVRRDYNYKAAAIRKRIALNKATFQHLSASVKSSGGGVHLTDIAGTRQTKTGVSVNVKKATGRRLISRAFIREARNSGKTIVFRRQEIGGKMVPRLPLGARYASHPEVIYNTPENWPRIQKQAGERLDKNFDHEVDTVLRGIA